MAAQHCLELGGRYLEALVLDQLLQPIDDREVAVLICVTDVARVEPALLIEHGSRGFRVVQVSPHDLRPADPELPVLAPRQLTTAGRIDDLAFGVRNQQPHRSGLCFPGLGRVGMGDRARLREPIALNHPTADPPGARSLQLGVERRCTGHHRRHARNVVLVHQRLPREREHDRRHDERASDPLLLDQPEERLELEAGHGNERRPCTQPEVQNDLQPVDVKERQHEDDPICFLDRM